MQRSNSFFWDGELGPTVIVDICKEAHSERNTLLKSTTSNQDNESDEIIKNYNTCVDGASTQDQEPHQNLDNVNGGGERRKIIPYSKKCYSDFSPIQTAPKRLNGHTSIDGQASIRFQVVVWSVGSIDVRHGRVAVKFRITLFWNDHNFMSADNDDQEMNGKLGASNNGATEGNSSKTYDMRGRDTAILISDSSSDLLGKEAKNIDVPPVSIINAEGHDIIGKPEVTVLREETKLMRWTCLYKAFLLQGDMKVDNFPHDTHELCLKIGILKHRKQGARWDKNIWKLQLATEDDSQNSTRIPHGLIVDHVQIPEFRFDYHEGLQFEFVPLDFGSRGNEGGRGKQQQIAGFNHNNKDQCLQISLKVTRQSGYYDKNVAPLLILLNLVGVSVMTINATEFFQRALLLLNITFVQIGIRMSLDSKLPSVGYEIKLQSIMNNYLYSLLFQVLESAALNVALGKKFGIITLADADYVDSVAVTIALIHGISLFLWYYKDLKPVELFCGSRKYTEMELPYKN